jgi:hypothetical protein
VEATATRTTRRSWWLRGIGTIALVYVVGVLALMWWWDFEPEHFDVVELLMTSKLTDVDKDLELIVKHPIAGDLE